MISILKITEAVKIGVKALVLIRETDSSDSEYYNVTKLSEKIGCSRHHLAKVMQRLSKTGFIKSMRGPTGGFKLRRKGHIITCLEVFETIEGPIRAYAGDDDVDKRIFNTIEFELNKSFRDKLDKITI